MRVDAGSGDRPVPRQPFKRRSSSRASSSASTAPAAAKIEPTGRARACHASRNGSIIAALIAPASPKPVRLNGSGMCRCRNRRPTRCCGSSLSDSRFCKARLCTAGSASSGMRGSRIIDATSSSELKSRSPNESPEKTMCDAPEETARCSPTRSSASENCLLSSCPAPR